MSRKLLVALLVLAGCSPAAPDAGDGAGGKADSFGHARCDPTQSPFGGGSGAANDPFLICSARQLERIGDAAWLSYYRLTRDLDLGEERLRAIGRFSGVFDGGNHRLERLFADGTAGRAALILEQDGYVRGLQLTDADVTGAALLAVTNHGVIEDCTVNGHLRALDSSPVAAIAATNDGLISRVTVDGATIDGSAWDGAIAGDNGALGVIADSQVQAEVHGSLYVGGAVGVNQGRVKRTQVAGKVLSPLSVGRAAGGLIGYNVGIAEDSSAAATVTVNNSAGGLVGRARGGVLRRSWADGDVTAEESAGSLIGLIEFGTTVEDCYALGRVHAQSHAEATQITSYVRSFVDVQATDDFANTDQRVVRISGADGAWRTVQPGDLASRDSFAGFDNQVWALDPTTLRDAGHPRLAWETSPLQAPVLHLVPVRFRAWSGGQPPTHLTVTQTQTGRITTQTFATSGGRGDLAYASVFVEPGPITFVVTDAWDDPCSVHNADSPDDPVPTTAEVADGGISIEKWTRCEHSQPLSVPQGPFLRAPRPGEVPAGDLLATSNGHEYRLALGRVTKDGVDITPMGWDLDEHRPFIDGDELYFVMDHATIDPGRGSPSEHAQDPVAQLGTPILTLSTGKWRQDKYGFFNVAGLDHLAYENGTITGDWYVISSGQNFAASQRLRDFLINSSDVQ